MGQVPPPLTNALVDVTDRRFLDRGYALVRYAVTDGWHAKDDPYVKDRLIGLPKMSAEDEIALAWGSPVPHSELIKHITWVLLLLPTGLVLYWGLFRKTTKSNAYEKH